MHAGDYGMSVPEELRPKMKESSAMAKALRALDALPHAPTHHAREAAEALGAALGVRGVVTCLSGWMQSGPRACLLAVVEAAGNDPEGFAVVADLVDQAVP